MANLFLLNFNRMAITYCNQRGNKIPENQFVQGLKFFFTQPGRKPTMEDIS